MDHVQQFAYITSGTPEINDQRLVFVHTRRNFAHRIRILIHACSTIEYKIVCVTCVRTRLVVDILIIIKIDDRLDTRIQIIDSGRS